MKKLRLWLFVVFVLQLTVLSANTHMRSGIGEKIYVTPGDIKVSEHGIFWQVEPGNWLPISKIECDCQGTYLSIGDIFGVWICRCGYWNSKFDNMCQRCGRPREETD